MMDALQLDWISELIALSDSDVCLCAHCRAVMPRFIRRGHPSIYCGRSCQNKAYYDRKILSVVSSGEVLKKPIKEPKHFNSRVKLRLVENDAGSFFTVPDTLEIGDGVVISHPCRDIFVDAGDDDFLFSQMRQMAQRGFAKQQNKNVSRGENE